MIDLIKSRAVIEAATPDELKTLRDRLDRVHLLATRALAEPEDAGTLVEICTILEVRLAGCGGASAGREGVMTQAIIGNAAFRVTHTFMG